MPIIRKPSKAVIMDAVTGKYKKFQFNPTPMQSEVVVDYAQMDSPGLAHPFFQYVGGMADEIVFTIYLDDKGEYKGYTQEFLNFLQTFRARDNSKFAPPNPVTIAYGENVRTGLIYGMSIQENRFDPISLIPVRAEVEVKIKSLPE